MKKTQKNTRQLNLNSFQKLSNNQAKSVKGGVFVITDDLLIQ